MSIATELQNYNTYLTNAYNKCSDKGATIPQNKNCQNLTNTINSIDIASDYLMTTYPNNAYGLNQAFKKQPNIVVASSSNNTQNLFANCRNIPSFNFTGFDISNVTTASSMFASCVSITSIDFTGLTNNKFTSINSMFQTCTNLQSINFGNIVFSSVTGWSSIFDNCTSLATISSSVGINMQKANNVRQMFNNCTALQNLPTFSNWGQNYTSSTVNYSYYEIDLSKSTSLTKASLMNVINGLYNLASASKPAQSLKLGATNLAKLSSSEIAVATNKGWNVS